MYSKLFVVLNLFCTYISTEEPASCRDRSNFFRQDGGLCFEIPPWQHQPVELESHMQRVRDRWQPDSGSDRRRVTNRRLGLSNSEISRYMDTVIGPFLDTYHRNIQNSYQQLTSKILRRIKEEVNTAVKRKQQLYKELTKLADDLEVPALCDEERRAVKTIASNHVAQIFACTEDARASIAKMGKYAEEMIALTRNHMQQTIGDVVEKVDTSTSQPGTLKNNCRQTIELGGDFFTLYEGDKACETKPDVVSPGNSRSEVETYLEILSKAAVSLGYELDLSLTNARRHNEQSCEKLTGCSTKARKRTEESVADLRDLLYQCVYT